MSKDLEKLLEWTKKAQEIFKKAGETDFKELKKKDKTELLESLEALFETKMDGDSDGMCEYVDISTGDKCFGISFWSQACCPDDFDDYMYNLELLIDDTDVGLAGFITHLEAIKNKKTEIINLTPHAITVLGEDDNPIMTLPSVGIARATREYTREVAGVPVSKTIFGAVQDLPDQADGVVYLVSMFTAQAMPGRRDLYIPDDIVRDDAGRISCRAFAQI